MTLKIIYKDIDSLNSKKRPKTRAEAIAGKKGAMSRTSNQGSLS